MTFSEGVVMKIHEGGQADVRIQEQNMGIIGAPDVNVCHYPSSGSIVITHALNHANALPGDRVCLEQPSKAIIKNIMALILIPLAGLLVGLIIGAVLYNARILSGSGVFFVTVLVFLSGLGTGFFIYKRIFKPSAPVIIDIIESRNSGNFPGK